MGKREVLWRIDELGGRGRRRELIGDLYQRSLSEGARADTEPPAIPTGLTLEGGFDRVLAVPGWIDATWDDNTEADLAGYAIRYRYKDWRGDYSEYFREITDSTAASIHLGSLPMDNDYFVSVAAFDSSWNQSDYCAAASTTVSYPIWPLPDAPDAPGVSVDFTSRDAIFTVTAGSEQNIIGVVYDVFT